MSNKQIEREFKTFYKSLGFGLRGRAKYPQYHNKTDGSIVVMSEGNFAILANRDNQGRWTV